MKTLDIFEENDSKLAKAYAEKLEQMSGDAAYRSGYIDGFKDGLRFFGGDGARAPRTTPVVVSPHCSKCNSNHHDWEYCTFDTRKH